MQVEINTDNLPEGMTERQVYDAIESSLMVYIGEFTGHRSHTEQVATAAQVWKALVKPAEETPVDPTKTLLEVLNSKDLTYLRLVQSETYGHNDYMKGWRDALPVREKLLKLKLVTVNHYPASPHPGQVDVTVCKPTPLGLRVIRKANRV